jgi:HAD superfamily hydrolase (TIGR01509 family)
LDALTAPLPARRPNLLPRIRAIVFDLDGVLVDSMSWWHEVRNEFAAAHDRRWTEADEAAMHGANTREWCTEIRKRLGLDMSEEEIEHAVIGGLLERYATRGAPAIDGAAEAIRRLSGRYSLAVASSAPTRVIEAALAGLGIRDRIRAVTSSDEAGTGKPAPDVFLLAARRLGVDPAECLVVEDSLNGILGARAAGMRVVLVPDPSEPPSAGAREAATYSLESLRELELDRLATA